MTAKPIFQDKNCRVSVGDIEKNQITVEILQLLSSKNISANEVINHLLSGVVIVMREMIPKSATEADLRIVSDFFGDTVFSGLKSLNEYHKSMGDK